MPVLPDPQHEAFAQNLAKGMAQYDAYMAAGYKAKGNAAKVNASRLLTNANVRARVTELTEKAAEKVVDDSAFEARSMFMALLKDIEDAKTAGDHKTALDGRKFFMRCFGYEDSPTLTHEHVKGSKLPPIETGNREDEQPEEKPSNIKSFSEALKKLNRRS